MFLHARKGHVEPLGKGCDRSVRTPELLQNAASGGVRERAERGIEVGLAILSHTVQYTTWVTPCSDAMQWEAERPLLCPAIHLNSRSTAQCRVDQACPITRLSRAASTTSLLTSRNELISRILSV